MREFTDVTEHYAPTEQDLAGRMARCYCGQECSSDVAIRERAFFEYRGEGSRFAKDGCKHCGYALVAHGPDAPVWKTGKTAVETKGCPGFEERGPHEFDTFYCGCRGWD